MKITYLQIYEKLKKANFDDEQEDKVNIKLDNFKSDFKELSIKIYRN